MSAKSGKKGAKTKSPRNPPRRAPGTVGDGPGGGVDHPPIIIDGGSTEIEFSSVQYRQSGHQQIGGSTLRLNFVRARHALHSNGSPLCHETSGNEVCLVVVHCSRSGQQPRQITVSGGRNKTPVIHFDHTEFGHISVGGGKKRRGNGQRKIFKLEIFRLGANGQPQGDPIHTCPLIPSNGRCSYEINDDHP